MNYTVVIRTLGTAGKKYQRELDSLCALTFPPKDIIVYIAEGYPLPKETCGKERYVYVKKGMVAQRALPYTEVETEWILFMDDDLVLPNDFMERMFGSLKKNNADVMVPDIFPNHERSMKDELMMFLSGRMRPRRGDKKYAYKVMRTCGYSYNKSPKSHAYISQTNAGACFLCKKDLFRAIHFEEELWLDEMPYAIGDDQVMFYKMYLCGIRQFTLFHTGIKHLDGSGNMTNPEKGKKLVEADYFFRKIFWTRFIQEPERNPMIKLWNRICIGYFYSFGIMMSVIKGDRDMLYRKWHSIKRAKEFLKSPEYASLPKIIRI